MNNDLSLEPFSFQSTSHQRYEKNEPKMGLQHCLRTINVLRNTKGCKGYLLEPGIGYIVQLINDDIGKPNMSDKPMNLLRKTNEIVELRGFPIKALSPFGWQDVDYSDYGLSIHYQNGEIIKCILYMFDRDIRIEYLK